MTRLMLVDGDNILRRGVEATRHVALHADGVNTAALLVFINSLSRHIREEAPDQVVVCWDGDRSSSFRLIIHPGYKAHRPARPEEADDRLRPHGLAKRWLTLSGVQHVERAGWEADDLIAAYWAQAGRGTDTEIVVISSDHDLLQLVGDRVTQVKVATGRNLTDRWDARRVCEHFRVPEVRHLPHVFALAGDPGDGVPGLPRVAHKTAAKLLAGAGWDWETLLASFDAQPGRETWHVIAQTAWKLVDLREANYPLMGLVVAPPGGFRPTSREDALWTSLWGFLSRYQLDSVLSRLDSGGLWTDAQSAKVSL